MLHNKYFDILCLFTEDYKKRVHGRSLIDKVNLSPKGIALALKELEEKNILRSKKEGNMKFYTLNHKYPQIKEIITMAELEKKTQFYSKNKAIAHIFKNDERMVGIFGSYAKGTQKKDSDIDVFVVGNKIPKDYDVKGKAYDLEINIIYFTEKEFKTHLNKKNTLIKEIVEKHILLFDIEKFVKFIWGNYHGFD